MEEEPDNILMEENYYQLLNVSKTVNIAPHVCLLSAFYFSMYRNYVIRDF